MIAVWLWWWLYHQNRNTKKIQVVSYDCESSLSLTSLLPWCLMLWSNPADAKSFAPTESSESLLHWVCIEISKRDGMTKVVFESIFNSACCKYMNVLNVLKKGVWFFQVVFYFFSGCLISESSIAHDLWSMLYCSRFWNYEILLIVFEIVRFKTNWIFWCMS